MARIGFLFCWTRALPVLLPSTRDGNAAATIDQTLVARVVASRP